MKANPDFTSRGMEFWAAVRLISQAKGYTKTGSGCVVSHPVATMRQALTGLGLDASYLDTNQPNGCSIGEGLEAYFAYRAAILNQYVKPRLMDVDRARETFEYLKETLAPSCPLPVNKQKREKKAPAFFTGIINMLIEANCGGRSVDYDPRSLTVVTDNGRPLRTMARRLDGCFPSAIDPIAVWEIKEYYYTTTFGSRVADGVYETILDGMELEELMASQNRNVLHYLMIDGHYTWWECGRAYLCRLIDVLHMGYIDEVLFGNEVVDELPRVVNEWVAKSSG